MVIGISKAVKAAMIRFVALFRPKFLSGFEVEPRIAQVSQIEIWLTELLSEARALPNVKDVRVKGAVGVVELAGNLPIDWLRRRFIDKGVWIRPFGNIIYLTPAFSINKADLCHLVESIIQVIEEMNSRGDARV